MATILVPKEEERPSELVGRSVSRVEGRLKVTGEAHYAADYDVDSLVYAVVIQSTIASGRIIKIDMKEAERAPGVLGFLTHQNAPKLNTPIRDFMKESVMDEKFLPLQDDVIRYAGQDVALVVADTFENASAAASHVKVTYEEKKPIVEFNDGMAQAYKPESFMGFRPAQIKRGDMTLSNGIKLERTYTTPVEHHNPMEPSSWVASWNGNSLTIYNSTQWVRGNRSVLSQVFGIPVDKIRVISYFTGGGFGSKGFDSVHEIVAALAARHFLRPIKLSLSRQQLFTSTTHRPATIQNLSLSATRDGRLTAIKHDTISQITFSGDFFEPCGGVSAELYACPNVEISHTVVPFNTAGTGAMRAPGEATGSFALESALDELSYELKIDPVELRMMNYANENPEDGNPWSSKYLDECYGLGSTQFGWTRRNPEPRSMKQGRHFLGWGMATAMYPGIRSPAAAKVRILPDGRALVTSATHDIGTGTYTILTQIAAETLGLPIEKVKVEMGDSSMPFAPVSGGSATAASVGTAVKESALAALNKTMLLAAGDTKSPLYGVRPEDMIAEEGGILSERSSDSFVEIIRRNKLPFIEAEATAAPGEEQEKFSFMSFGSVFAGVMVDSELGEVRVSRVVGVYDVGKVINPKTARSQLIGGIVMGIGMALMEHTVYERVHGRAITTNLADYTVPVNADINKIDVEFIDKPDPHISSLGARGVGEIGITGVAGAVANAVYHATGKRVRDLPITPDKLL